MYLGLDIGTTTVCGVVLDESGAVVRSVTKPNGYGVADGALRTQDAQGILSLCKEIYEGCLAEVRIDAIGISGQMHGMLYVNGQGEAISPLYSWQDGRGDLPYLDGTYASVLCVRSGHRMATGFGGTSLFFDAMNGLIPPSAASICTVGDYVAMRLGGRCAPLLHPTCAASMGVFDLQRGAWDEAAIARASLPLHLFPMLTDTLVPLGKTAEGALVYPAVGDNQASVYGALADEDGAYVINVGTGSQLSLVTERYCAPTVGELRPYFGGRYLLAGSALCGGYSFRLLRDFFRAVGADVDYDTMNAWAEDTLDGGLPTPDFLPAFRGSREDPDKRASITGICEENFTPQGFVLSLMRGVSRELRDFYDAFVPLAGERRQAVGAGNAVRLNSAFRRVLCADHGVSLAIPLQKEEAAFGAALLAAEAFTGKSCKDFIRYE